MSLLAKSGNGLSSLSAKSSSLLDKLSTKSGSGLSLSDKLSAKSGSGLLLSENYQLNQEVAYHCTSYQLNQEVVHHCQLSCHLLLHQNLH